MLQKNGITHLVNVAEGKGAASCGPFDKSPYEGIQNWLFVGSSTTKRQAEFTIMYQSVVETVLKHW